MKMKKWIITICLMGVTLVGCEQLYNQAGDPNSPLNVVADTVAAVAPAVTGVITATAASTPWGAITLIGLNILTVVVAAYKNHKKNLVIGEKDEEFQNVETVTKFMVDVVENLPDETQAKFKELIGSKLKDNDFYKIGKAIISGLKG